MMLYELSADGYTVGVFPTEAAARHNAAYMPGGCYTIREWTRDGDFLTFDPSTNNTMTSGNDTQIKEARAQYDRARVRVQEALRPGERRYWSNKQKEAERRILSELRARILRIAPDTDGGN